MPTSPSAPGAAVAARLDALRGPVPPRSHDARTIAALTVNPGCSRRAVLDAAGIDKRRLAERVGSPARFGQSPFAITRGLMFEKHIKADGCAQLLDLLRTELGFDVPEHEYVDLGVESATDARGAADGSSVGGALDRGSRYRRTRDVFAQVAAGATVLADHPLLTLDVAGRTAYVEPDVVAVRARRSDSSLLYVTEVKSFAVIDGQADPIKVGAAATQSAVYVLALRRLFASLGVDPDMVASDVILVCPKDFSNSPTAHLVDVRRQLAAVSRQLDRLPRIEALVAGLDPAIDFDLSVDQSHGAQDVPHPHRSAADLSKSLAMVEARYAPECVTRCELAFHCRAEARAAGSADALGRSVRDALGGIELIDEVLALAAGTAPPTATPPTATTPTATTQASSNLSATYATVGHRPASHRPGNDEAARLLRAAARAYDEAAAMEPRAPEPSALEAGTGDEATFRPIPVPVPAASKGAVDEATVRSTPDAGAPSGDVGDRAADGSSPGSDAWHGVEAADSPSARTSSGPIITQRTGDAQDPSTSGHSPSRVPSSAGSSATTPEARP